MNVTLDEVKGNISADIIYFQPNLVQVVHV